MRSWVIWQVFFFNFPLCTGSSLFLFFHCYHPISADEKKWLQLLCVLLFIVTVACFISYYCAPETQRATYQVKNVALNGHCRTVCTAGTFCGSYRTSPSFACSHWVGVWWVMGIFSVLDTLSLSCWFSHLHTVANHFAREKWGKGVFKNLSAIQQNSTAEAWCRNL